MLAASSFRLKIGRDAEFRRDFLEGKSYKQIQQLETGGRMSQVWLVTGSSRGLGRAIVEASLAAGNKVMATARNTESLNDLSDRYGNQVKLFALDVTDESAATAAVKTAIDTFGSLDVIVNNAGYGNLSSVEDTPMSDFRAQIETNLSGTIILTKAALRISAKGSAVILFNFH